MKIEEFIKQYIDKNNVSFTKIDEYSYTKENNDLLEKFYDDNPKKVMPNNYVIDDYRKGEYLKLVNLDSLVMVEIIDPNTYGVSW